MADKTADRRLYFNADQTKLVEGDDPEAATLAAAPGDPIPDVKKADQPENKAQSAPAEDKSANSDDKPKRRTTRKKG